MSSPDIEIYIAGPAAPVLEWLAQRFPGTAAPRPAGRKQWRLALQQDGRTLPALVIEDAAPGFTSLWIDSPHGPWPDDRACARDAFARFGTEVRATPGSWAEGDDPDLWWHINDRGEGLLRWPG